MNIAVSKLTVKRLLKLIDGSRKDSHLKVRGWLTGDDSMAFFAVRRHPRSLARPYVDVIHSFLRNSASSRRSLPQCVAVGAEYFEIKHEIMHG